MVVEHGGMLHDAAPYREEVVGEELAELKVKGVLNDGSSIAGATITLELMCNGSTAVCNDQFGTTTDYNAKLIGVPPPSQMKTDDAGEVVLKGLRVEDVPSGAYTLRIRNELPSGPSSASYADVPLAMNNPVKSFVPFVGVYGDSANLLSSSTGEEGRWTPIEMAQRRIELFFAGPPLCVCVDLEPIDLSSPMPNLYLKYNWFTLLSSAASVKLLPADSMFSWETDEYPGVSSMTDGIRMSTWEGETRLALALTASPNN
jgi:hypothetical protein